MEVTENYQKANQESYQAYCQLQLVERYIEDMQYKKSMGQQQLTEMLN